MWKRSKLYSKDSEIEKERFFRKHPLKPGDVFILNLETYRMKYIAAILNTERAWTCEGGEKLICLCTGSGVWSTGQAYIQFIVPDGTHITESVSFLEDRVEMFPEA